MPRVMSLLSLLALLALPALAVEAPSFGDSCMVATAHPLATELGVRVLREGGNAVDATVAVSLTLAGVEPYSSGIGGGGFFVLHDAATGNVRTLDARETAPEVAHRDMFLVDGVASAELSQDGPRASGVPGLVAGLWELHRGQGTLPWSQLVNAAADQIENLTISPMLHRRLDYHQGRFNEEARRVFLPAGVVPPVGASLVQEDLVRTLRAIASEGPRVFYEGDVARAICDVTRGPAGAGITLEDLRRYEPRWRQPVIGTYGDLEIVSMGPPSSGGVHLVQMLNILEAYPLGEWGYGSADAVHHLAEAMKFAYADRSLYLGDADFVDVPLKRLAGKGHAEKQRKRIEPHRAIPEKDIEGAPLVDLESRETTHLSIVDGQGSAVAATLTINLSFGSARMAPGTGILMNNEMDDFVAAPGVPNAFGLVGGEANAITAGKRPLSSMTPTIVRREGRVFMVLGAPGGSKIITTTLQNILNVVDHGMDALQAVSAPRVHHQWFPPRLYLEEYGLSPDTCRELEARGHVLKIRSPMCNAQVIMWDDERGGWQGASDPRGMGQAAGF